MLDESEKVLLIDGSFILYRVFFGWTPSYANNGFPTAAIRGFIRNLNNLIAFHKPKYLAIVFDIGGKNHRHEINPFYKSTRPPTPEDLTKQRKALIKLLSSAGLRVVCFEGMEGDDLLGTLSRIALQAGHKVLIATGDKDMAQLVSDRVHLVNPYSEKWPVMSVEKVNERFGVRPDQIPDLLALAGDTSDCIQGIKGVGEKTAAAWLREYNSIDAMLSQLYKLPGTLANKIKSNEAIVLLAQRQTIIKTDLAIKLTLEDLIPTPADVDFVKSALDSMNLGYLSIANQYHTEAEDDDDY